MDTLIAFLQNPASYPHAVNGVETIETHVARVFLAGDYAYKLKKPVQFPYLDYSTLEKRHHMVEEELVRNKRTAPNLYLQAVPVYEQKDGYTFTASGDPIEWLVQMRRFDGDKLLDKVTLDLPLLKKLAEKLVHFHRIAESITPVDAAENVRQTILGNDGLFAHFAAYLPRARTEALTAHSLALAEQHQAILRARAARGEVRRCHGDLHLRNIALYEGEPLLFDCIEFNDAFADIDVLYDLAFLLMDLRFRGQQSAADRVLEAYIAHSAQEDGLVLLPLFCSMRAAIRAHVGVAVALAHPVSEQPALLAEATQYLALAEDYLRPHQPTLTAIGGLSGSGKSTLAAAMAGAEDNTIVLRSDILRKVLAGVAETTPLSPSHYTDAASQAVYHLLGAKANALLAAGYHVIVDAVFAKPEERQAMETLANKAGIPFTGIWLETPLEIAKMRLDTRQEDASDASFAVRTAQESYNVGIVTWEKRQG